MCKCYVITAEIRFVQCIENDDDLAEAEQKALQSLDTLPAMTVKGLKVQPFGESYQ